MNNFFGQFYCLFQSFFGNNLADCLWGYNCSAQDYTGTVVFGQIGFWTLGIVLSLTILYYYVFNPVKYSRWYHWLAYGGFISLICFFLGWCLVPSLDSIQTCLLIDETSGVQLITEMDRVGFGLANLLVSFIEFVLFSFIIKWWSVNCRYTPF